MKTLLYQNRLLHFGLIDQFVDFILDLYFKYFTDPDVETPTYTATYLLAM